MSEMSRHVRLRLSAFAAVSVATLIAPVAIAQVPTISPSGSPGAVVKPDGTLAPDPAAPPPEPARDNAPSDIRIVQIGPDGKVMQANPDNAPSKPAYYDDTVGDDVRTHNGPTPELHVVRQGDNLWDISWYYFNDPWQWPKVWSYNAQITNPHWIYPGDLVRLTPKGEYVTPAADTGVAKLAPGTLTPVKHGDLDLRQFGFVSDDDLAKATQVSGAPEDKQLLSRGDAVYLTYPEKNPPKVGDTLSLYRAEKKVALEGKSYGAYVRILGTLQITSVKKDKQARGVIIESNSEIERGAKVGPLITHLTTANPVAAKVDAQGTIIAMLTKDQLIGEGEVVFLNLGEKSGLEVGNRMYVVRRGDAYIPIKAPVSAVGQDDRRYPARTLGEIAIVQVGKDLSMAVVTASLQEMGIGDLVMMLKSNDQ